MFKFECLKCGSCCRNLFTKVDDLTLGMFLVPFEVKLFPKERVLPLYGSGRRGKKRPRPEIVYAYQFAGNVCIYLGDDNLCKVYERRPFACRSYPLYVHIPPFGGMLDRRCACVGENFNEGERKEVGLESIREEMVAQSVIRNTIIRGLKKAKMYGSWAYDVVRHRWVRL